MKTFNTYFKDEVTLKEFLAKSKITDNKRLLIQVFIGINELTSIKSVLSVLRKLLPSAKIIGATTDGEIMNARVSTNRIVLSFTQFYHTNLKTHIEKRVNNEQNIGANLAKNLIEKDTKVIITLTDGLHANGENYLKSITTISKDVVVAGGMAGDNSKFEETFVFTENDITSNGAVGVALNNASLHVHTEYSFNWKPIGKYLTITKVKDNRVFTIDNKTAYETYAYYLGEEMAKKLPAIGVEFPLILKRNSILIARAVLLRKDDGSLIFAGNLKEKDRVQIGFGNAEMILKDSAKSTQSMQNKAVESIFVYSCMARRRFMPKAIYTELQPLQNIANTSGFFTYGEFYSGKEKELLNQTMTILAISETNLPVKINSYQLVNKNDYEDTIRALSHIINVTTNELTQTNERLTLAIEGSQDGLWEWDIKNRYLYLSPKYKEILGFNECELKNSIWCLKNNLDKKLLREVLADIKKCMRTNIENFNNVYKLRYIKEEKWIHVRAKIFFDSNKKPLKMAGFITDATELKKAQEKIQKQQSILHYQAYHDILTNLPNRALFLDRLNQAIKKAKRKSTKVAVLFVDLDNFKKINDSMGHKAGDKVLVKVSKIFQQNLRDSDTLARLAGDEFTILVDEFSHIRTISNIAQKLLQMATKPLYVDNQKIYVTYSIGISLYPDDGLNATTLLKNSDAAMHKAKDEGKNRYQYYKQELTEKAFEKLVIETSLRGAIQNGELEVYYQPQVNTLSEKIVGMEALVRWNHPTLGLVPPDRFIPIASESDLIIRLDEWVMKEAMKNFVRWLNDGLNPGYISLNLTIKQLEDENFMQFLKDALEQTKCPTNSIELEILESQIMKKADKSIKILNEIRKLGIRLSIDDFGTGYSSLAYLKKLPIEKIKIDKSFVKNIPYDNEDMAIVKAIVSIAKNLNLITIAEGVETKEQRDFMLQCGCDKIQGYYYSRPLPSNQMKKVLTSGIIAPK